MGKELSIKLQTSFGMIILGLILSTMVFTAKATDYSSFVPNKITFIGDKGLFNQEMNLERTLSILGNNTAIANVTLVCSSLYGVNMSGSIPSVDISFSRNNFDVSNGTIEDVNVNLRISDQKAGVYEGHLFVLFDTSKVAEIDLQLVLNENSMLKLITSYLVIATVVFIFSLTVFVLLLRKWSETQNLVASSTLIGIGIFLVLFLSPLVATANLALIATLFSPLIGYIISILNTRRDFQKKMQDLSYDYRDRMVQEDSKIIRAIIGELTIHYASFNADDWPEPSGIPDEVWKKSDKVGIIADIHTNFLARYYRYVPVYNQSVAKLLELSKNRADIQISLKKDFEEVRKIFCEMETHLYLTLAYDLGLLQQRFLAKELVSFPMHMTELLRIQLTNFKIIAGAARYTQIDREAYSEENASKFTTQMGKLFNYTYARAEISIRSLQNKLEKTEKDKQSPSFLEQ
jgi:hypothetical protein